ncbi:MAG: hypothetical protein M3N19_10770 [Candidatus Eremiobacteraeota bacterium]|nr:hypothetical protein [Candidatus Eremiobacteraeota bacterium]
MKLERIMDESSAAALRVDWLIAELEPVSDYGRRIFARLEPFAPGEEAAATSSAAEIAEFASAVGSAHIDAMRDALRGVPDATSAIARAGMGDALSDLNFLEIQRFCDVLERIEPLLAGQSVYALPRCTAVAKVLEPGRSGKFGFYLEDRFDDALADSRAHVRDAQTAFDTARGRLGTALEQAVGRQAGDSGEFIVMRDELKGNLPSGLRVVREAPTYYLCELELDEAALAALRLRDDRLAALAEREEATRAALSAVIARHSVELQTAAHQLGVLDVLAAAARFCLRHNCVPASYARTPTVDFEDAYFLPLQSDLNRQDRAYTPITVSLSEATILTGPNMGGKSVALQTCGFIAACASFGIPVPAKSATVALFAQMVWLGINSNDDGAGTLLSSFAREIVRLRDALAAAAEPPLFLVDELARTTTPDEGRALLLALMARLRDRRICAFVATHLSGIARDASAPHYAVRGLRGAPHEAPSENLQEALAALARLMDYTIEPVTDDRAGSADALFLAGMLGLDRNFIQTAWQMLAKSEVEKP